MAFIDDNEIEEVRRQEHRLIPDNVEHRRVGGNIHTTIRRDQLFTHIGPARLVGHMLLEGGQCLFTQRDTVHEEQHFFCMASPHQGIDRGDAGARLAGAGGHHQQEITLLLFDAFEHRAYRADLVITSGNRSVDELLRQWFAIATDVGEAFEIVAGRKANHLARRRVLQIPEIELVAIGVEAEWQLTTQLFLDVVAILFGLLAANGSILYSFLCLNYSQWFAIFT